MGPTCGVTGRAASDPPLDACQASGRECEVHAGPGLVDTDAHHRRLFRRAGLTRWEIAEHRLDTRGQARLELGKLERNPFLGRDPRWPQRERRIPTQSVDLLTKSLRGVEGAVWREDAQTA